MLRKIIIAFALGCALAVAQVTDSKEDGIPPQPISGHSTSPSPISTTSEIISTSGAPAPRTNSTAAPTTPSPTTPAPTTSAPTTSAPTTSATNTTTPPASTTEPPPVTSTALPPPSKGHYFVLNDTDNSTCILADLAVQVKVVDGNKTWDFDVVPNNTKSAGVCNNGTQDLSLSWEDMGENYTLIFQFSKNGTKFMVSQISLTILQQNTTLNLTDNAVLFTASVSKSYRCEKEQEVKLTEGEKNSTTYAVLKLSDLQMEAFHVKGNSSKFSAAEDCASGSSPDIVPIAVGCALVGLIAIVLIAYLVGRRRSQARGYLSM